MKNIFLAVLLFILAGEGVTLLYINQDKSKEKVLAESTTMPTVAPTPTPSPTTSPTPVSTLKPTPVPIPKPTYTSQQINEFIERFASQYGVDPNVIRSIALCESGFNSNAVNLDYAGLFQFGPITWKNIRKEIGEDPDINLRFNAEESVQTAAYAISIGKRGIWPNCNP
jgi:soluble lytic murein transglycosylase-like protein